MEPDDLTIDPGSQATTKVTVRNIGTRVEEFELVIQGPGADFATVTPATVSVYPDVEQRAVVRFAPLRGPQSPAGVSTFEILARSVVHADVRDVARGRLTVTAFEDLQAVLKPDASRGRKPARHLVSVTNGGNTPMNSQVAFTDQDKVLTFEPRDTAVMLQPGGTSEVPVLLNGPRRWFGRTERLPFAAVVTPAGAQQPITLNGTRQQTPVFPWWMPPAALAIVAVLIALAALLKPGTPTVPGIGNDDQQVAVKKLEDAQYTPALVYEPDSNIGKGFAIGTDPKGGTQLKHGETVKLLISQGKCVEPCPVLVGVPNVVGLQKDTATAQLQQMNLVPRIQEKTGEDPAGQVIDEDPKANTPSPTGTQVLLTVSSGPKSSPGNAAGGAAAGGAAAGGAAGGAAAGGGAGAGGGGAGGGGSGGGGSGPPPPKQVAVPALKNSSATDATAALEKLGLKAKTETVHSNAVSDGKVLSSKPDASAKVDPGSDVTLTVAQNTAPVDLIATAADKTTTWTNGSGASLTVGAAKATDTTGFVQQSTPLVEGARSKVLETNPQEAGAITGVYKLAEPLVVVPGDHIHARVGVLPDPSAAGGSTEDVTFVVAANGNDIKTVVVKDTKFHDFDADLSAVPGVTSFEITVRAGSSPTKDTPVWQGLQLKPTIGK